MSGMLVPPSTIRAFCGELQKIAETELEDAKLKRRGNLLGLGGLAGQIGGGLGMYHMAMNAPGEDAALAQSMAAKSEIPVRQVHMPIPNAYWAPKGSALGRDSTGRLVRAADEHIGVSPELARSPAILAHEMGHGAIDKNLVGKLVQNKVTGGLAALGNPIGVIGGGASAFSDDPRMQALGRWAPAIAAAPQLAYEGGASLIGLGKMVRSGAKGRQLLRGAATLAPAWGTYAGAAAMNTGIAHLTQHQVRTLRKAYQKKHQAEGGDDLQ